MWTLEKLKCSFEAARNPAQEVRVSGELALNEFAIGCPTFIPMLISFSSHGSMAQHDRHLAMVLLNQHVQLSWKAFPEEWHLLLTTFAFRWSTQEPHVDGHLRRSAMALLTKIYGMSDQDEMGQMASSLQSLLQTGDLPVKIVTAKTLCEIAKDVEYFRQMFLLRWCYTILQGIIEDYTGGISDTIRCSNANPDRQSMSQLAYYATKMMRFCVSTLGEANISSGFEEDEASFILSDFIPHWVTKNCNSMATFVNQPECIMRNLAMMIDLCCSLSRALDYFAEDCGVELKDVCVLAFSLLRTVEPHYHQGKSTTISNSHTGYSSDGDRIDLEILVLHLFELINVGMANLRADDEDTVVDESDRETIDGTVQLLTHFMMLNDEQIEMWVEAPNDYLLVECNDANETDYLRNVCADVLREICCGSKGSVYVSILSALHLEFSAKEKLFRGFFFGVSSSNRQSDMIVLASRILETLSWILGVVGKGYVSAFLKSRKVTSHQGAGGKQVSKTDRYSAITKAAPPQEVLGLVQAITAFVFEFPTSIAREQSTKSPSNEAHTILAILQYRVLWLCGEVIYLFQGRQTTCDIAKKCEDIVVPGNFLSLRLQACRTLTRILKRPQSYFEVLEEVRSRHVADEVDNSALNVDALVNSIVELVPHCNESSLHVPLGTLTFLVKSHGTEFTEAAVRCVAQMIVEVLSRFCNDSITVDIVDEMLTHLLEKCRGKSLLPAIHTVYIPFAKTVILSEAQCGRLIDSFVDVVIASLSRVGTSLVQSGDLKGSSVCMRDVLEILVATFSVPYMMDRYAGCIVRAISGVLECLPQQHWDQIPIFQSIALPLLVNSLLTSLIEIIHRDTTIEANSSISERDFAAVMGLFCHLTLNAGHLLGIEVFGSVLVSAFQVTKASKSSRLRHTFCISLVNLLARNAIQTLHLLNHSFDVMQDDSRGFFFSLWEQMHDTMDSRYNVFVSSVALIEVICALHSMEGMSAIKLKLLEMLLDQLPAMLAPDGKKESTTRRSKDGSRNAFTEAEKMYSDDRDSYSDNECESSLDASDFESDDSGLDVDDDDDDDDDIKSDGAESPFAPAELYLSDMISSSNRTDIHGGGGDDDSYTAALASGVPEDIMYRLAGKSDPLLGLAEGCDNQVSTATQVHKRVVDMLNALRSGQQDFPSLAGQLSQTHRSIMESLLIT